MFPRLLATELAERLRASPAVVLLGPRQVGKTTLALAVGEQFDSVYLDLESPADLAKLQEPLAYFAAHPNQLIICDEIQRTPGLFPVLRGVIDQRRRRGQGAGQFLLLGSASLDVVNMSSESLAGRISRLELAGLSPLEVPPEITSAKLWLRGGYPGSLLAAREADSLRWREDLRQSYSERDIPQLNPRISPTRLRRLWTLLAHLQGTSINVSELAGNLELSRPQMQLYIDALADLLLVRSLPAWHGNVLKRTVKSPRTYIRDAGLVHALLGIPSYDALLAHPILGKSWEGHVIENVCAMLPAGVKAYYYKTSAGAEIDLVLVWADGTQWAVEIKFGLAPKIKPGFFTACNDLRVAQRWVIYSGTDSYPGRDHVQFTSLPAFLRQLKSSPGHPQDEAVTAQAT